ncbi:glucosaminidase domain-containing protein, partial [Achromobacter denitrificans]|uniref:glucosaminidase domain-containing protein n=2 Tax=Achromobacter TaxID=222 RepID=UPI003B9D387A
SNDEYRAYGTPEQFGEDFAGLLGRRYQGAMNAGQNAQQYAEALKAGGYAEDPDYVRKLVAATETVRGLGGIGGAMDRLAGAIFPSAEAAGSDDIFG